MIKKLVQSFLNQYNLSCTGTSCLQLVQSDILKDILFWGVINKTGAWFFRGILKEQIILNNLQLLTSHPSTTTFYLPLLFFLLFFFLCLFSSCSYHLIFKHFLFFSFLIWNTPGFKLLTFGFVWIFSPTSSPLDHASNRC